MICCWLYRYSVSFSTWSLQNFSASHNFQGQILIIKNFFVKLATTLFEVFECSFGRSTTHSENKTNIIIIINREHTIKATLKRECDSIHLCIALRSFFIVRRIFLCLCVELWSALKIVISTNWTYHCQLKQKLITEIGISNY